MSRPIRTVTPEVEALNLDGWFVFEVSMRTIMGQFTLVPTKRRTDLIKGVLAHFLNDQTDVRMHTFSFQSNHFHMLLSVQRPSDLSMFMCRVACNLTNEMHAVTNEEKAEDEPKSEGPIWQRRYDRMAVSGLKVDARMVYHAQQGVFEGVIADPRHWTGATALPWLLEGEALKGLWVWRRDLTLARTRWEKGSKRKPAPKEADYAEWLEVPMHPAPGWEGLSEHQRRTKTRKIVQKIVHDGAAHRAKHKIGVLGMEKAAEMPSDHRPKKMKRGPRVHCVGTRAVRFANLLAVMTLTEARATACKRLLAGVSYKDSGFPEIEHLVLLPNELQALRRAEERAARHEAAGA